MFLELDPAAKNSYPVTGFLLSGASPAEWLRAIQAADIALNDAQIFPLPGKTANSVWGCLVTIPAGKIPDVPHTLCQLAEKVLYIPSFTHIMPALTKQDFTTLFKGKQHLFHPYLGLVELPDPVSWEDLLVFPAVSPISVSIPSKSIFIPGKIDTFLIAERSPEELIAEMEANLFPEKKTWSSQPLSFYEKIKLSLLNLLYGSKKPEGNSKPSLPEKLAERFMRWCGLEKKMERLAADYEELQERNKKEVDKLLDMFRKDPFEALQYAVPIDSTGASRGNWQGQYQLSLRWGNFSLGGSSRSGSGTFSLPDDELAKLRSQYQKTAQELEKNKEYEKAAFVYLKLLNNPIIAAVALEKGKLFAEAAALYQKHNNLLKAAECYHKASMTLQAIELYKQLKDAENVAMLYASLNRHEEAARYYRIFGEELINKNQFLKAAEVHGRRLDDRATALQLLLRGWKEGKESVQCLQAYMQYFEERERIAEIRNIYTSHVHSHDAIRFIRFLKSQCEIPSGVATSARALIFELLAKHADEQPELLEELKFLQPGDTKMIKDIVLYRSKRQNNR